MKILVTGACGYIGSMLVPHLLSLGHEVTALDLFPVGAKPLAAHCHNPRLKLVRQDVTERGIQEHYEAAEVIMPLAGIVGAPACDRAHTAASRINWHVISDMFDYLDDQRVIFPMTTSGYGSGGECTEDSPLSPVSHYGKTKMQAEEAVLNADVSLRLATVFGQSPSFRPELLVNDLVRRAVKERSVVIFEGHFRRNFVHVTDVCRAFSHALENFGTMRGQAYNVGLSETLTKLQLCERIKAQVPDFTYVEAPIAEDVDKRDCVISTSRIGETGWYPTVSLDKGIAELIRSYV